MSLNEENKELVLIKLDDGNIEYQSPDGSVTGIWRSKFAEQAMIDAYCFYDLSKLNLAIKSGVTEILDEEYRDVFLEIVNGKHRRKGHSPARLKSKILLERRVWDRVNYWEGKGFTLKDETQSETAVEIAARELSKSPDRVYKIYLCCSKKMEELGFSWLRTNKKISFQRGQMDTICERAFEYEKEGKHIKGVGGALEKIASELKVEAKTVQRLYKTLRGISRKRWFRL